jgi:protein-disulfide isomerase
VEENPSNNLWGLSVAILVLGGVVAGALYISNKKFEGEVAGEKIQVVEAINSEPTEGAEDALLEVILYTDLDCEFCRNFDHEVWQRFRHEYLETGKVRALVRLFPIGRLYAEDAGLTETTYCAYKQGMFNEAIEVSFKDQQLPMMDEAVSRVTQLVPDPVALRDCVESGEGAVMVSQASRKAIKTGVTAVPAIEIAGNVYEDVNSFEELSRIVNAILNIEEDYE